MEDLCFGDEIGISDDQGPKWNKHHLENQLLVKEITKEERQKIFGDKGNLSRFAYLILSDFSYLFIIIFYVLHIT